MAILETRGNGLMDEIGRIELSSLREARMSIVRGGFAPLETTASILPA
jgi:hypothetical protein